MGMGSASECVPVPMMVTVPRDHGEAVPRAFVRRCEEVIEMFHMHISRAPDEDVNPTRAAQVVQAFTWFMMDSRELAHAPASRDELVERFKEWYSRNVHGGPTDRELERYLSLFFRFVEENRVAAIHL